MPDGANAVHDAIERWTRKGIIDADLAARLGAEVAEADAAGTRRMSQWLLASVGGIILVIAAGVFVEWAWPLMDDPMRTGFLALAAVLAYAAGMRIERGLRWLPAAWLLQVSGLSLLLSANLYSQVAWEDRSAIAAASAGASLALTLALAPRAMRRGPFLPAAHLAFGLGFLAVFLDRATGLDEDAIVWVIDGALVVTTLWLVHLLRSDPEGKRHPWVLNAFVTAIYGALLMILLTGFGPLDLDDAVAWPVDAWLLLVVGLTHWGIHSAPPGLRREWFGRQMAYCVLFWIPLAFWTALGTVDGPPEVALIFLVGAGVGGFMYATHHGTRSVLVTSGIAFVVGTWYWGVARAGALGAVAALVVTAALLFWLSGRWGDDAEGAPRGRA